MDDNPTPSFHPSSTISSLRSQELASHDAVPQSSLSLTDHPPQGQSTTASSPSLDELEELLLDCRYGELESITKFIETYGVNVLANARDERGNNVLHMCAANGHDDILAYILSLSDLPPSLLTSGNDAGNTPLHWACLNSQLACAKLLVDFRSPSCGNSDNTKSDLVHQGTTDPGRQNDVATQTSDLKLGPALILARNTAGHTPLGEAERNGWDEGARWLVSVMDMDLQLASSSSSSLSEEEAAGPDVDVENNDDVNDDNNGHDRGGVEEAREDFTRLEVSKGERESS